MDGSSIRTVVDWVCKRLPVKSSLQHKVNVPTKYDVNVPTQYELKIVFDKGTLILLIGGLILVSVTFDRIFGRSTMKKSMADSKPPDWLTINVNEISFNGVSLSSNSENTAKPIRRPSSPTPRSPKDGFQRKSVGLPLILKDFGNPNVLHWSSLRKGDTPAHVYTESFEIQKRYKQVFDTFADSEQTSLESGVMNSTRDLVVPISGRDATGVVYVEKWLFDSLVSVSANQIMGHIPERSITRILQVGAVNSYMSRWGCLQIAEAENNAEEVD